jgi:RNA polymerase sigma factor (sigma-70 family)
VREELLRELAPQVLGAVVRRFGDFSAAEDAVQEALLAAALQWPQDGVPDNPRGWLIQVAIRRMTDQIRSDSARRRREGVAVTQAELDQPASPAADAGLLAAMAYGAANADGIDLSSVDDTLILLFMCCHPSLTPASATVLTLRAVGGLTTAEIAKAFMVPEATMAQRISRAKKTIKTSGVPFSLPTERERGERLDIVLHVLYLIFSEGYTSTAGESLHRVELSNEAIRLTRILHASLGPSDTSPEVAGLLALMLLTDARRAARVGDDGDLIPLDEQDRSRWDRDAIKEGIALLSEALPRGVVGPYQLQAAIAALHDEAQRAEDPDWAQILAFYGLLERMSDNPMVSLNHAIATAMVHGPAAGLMLLDGIEARGQLTEHHRLPAVRAHLLEMAGEHDAALENYRAAASMTASLPEQRYLLTRAERLKSRTRRPFLPPAPSSPPRGGGGA